MRNAPPVDMRIVSESSPTRRLVIQRLTDAIVEGRFPPGERLIERELCAMLGVSRTTLREALRELEGEGLVENIPNKGPIVATISMKQAQAIYDVRGLLEGYAARLFAQRASAAQVRDLAQAVTAIGAVYADFDPARFIAAKATFYRVLLEGADNETLAQSLRGIHVRVSQLRILSLRAPRRADASLRELKRLVRKLRERDAAGAEAECVAHVANAARAALATMAAASPQ